MADYISREAVEKAIDSVYTDLYPDYVPNSIAAFRECLLVDIGIIPTADVKPVKYSSWEYRTYPIVDRDGVARRCMTGYVCKACGHGEPEEKRFCGGCGAEMQNE